MNQTIIILLMTFWGVSINSYSQTDTIKYEPNNPIEFDTIPYMIKDTYFTQAYDEIDRMLDGKDSLSVKRAEFLVEWAYMEGQLNYDTFCYQIDSVTTMLSQFILANGLQQYKTAGNFALFEYFTKPNTLNGNIPFKYDFEDFAGENDFTKLFVTKVMRTHTGQCTSLPLYYKILADELGADAYIALAPNHMYVKHLSEDGKWVNIELTNGHFSTDAWMISSMDISAESIKNKVYLDALDDKKTVAHILTTLAQAYKKKYGYDYFTLKCVNKTIEYFPQNMPALFIKFNTHLYFGQQYISKYGEVASTFNSNNYKEYKATKALIENLGYRELSAENYQKWLDSMDDELKKQNNKQ
ncbi:hypothetical protein [Dysgonomonas capnocytophagoides]|uniref:hypothetical protein n=1 Tax=Dysgonomonas capnocytophagoides TaxID=45254 RepID=UPI00054EA403|nr:hypothetical protein [Dysgonomonas capnocytophagoides]